MFKRHHCEISDLITLSLYKWESQDKHTAKAAVFHQQAAKISCMCSFMHTGSACTHRETWFFSLLTSVWININVTQEARLIVFPLPSLFSICYSVSPDQAVAQLLHVSCVTGAFSGQNAPMDGGMKGLHSAAQHLGMSGQVRHVPAAQQQVQRFKTRVSFLPGEFLRMPTWRSGRRPAGLWRCHPKPPVTDPHPPNVWRTVPVQSCLTRSKVLRGKRENELYFTDKAKRIKVALWRRLAERVG